MTEPADTTLFKTYFISTSLEHYNVQKKIIMKIIILYILYITWVTGLSWKLKKFDKNDFFLL